MLNHGWRCVFAALLLLLMCAFAAQAREPEHRPFEVSAFGGVSFIGDVAGTPGAKYGDSYLIGMRVWDNQWRHLGFAFGYAFSNQPLTFTGVPGQPSSVAVSHSVHRVSYDLVIYPFDNSYRLRPYAFTGPGVSIFRIGSKQIREGLGLSSPVQFAWEFGGGVKYLIQDHIAVGVEYRDTFSDTPRYALEGYQPSGLLHNSQISVAFHYQWGY